MKPSEKPKRIPPVEGVFFFPRPKGDELYGWVKALAFFQSCMVVVEGACCVFLFGPKGYELYGWLARQFFRGLGWTLGGFVASL